MQQKRSRDGCWTCRKRKKKCDSSKTPCANCTGLKITCERKTTLIWEDDKRRAGMKRRGPPRGFERAATNTTPGKLDSDSTQMVQLCQSPLLGPHLSNWAAHLSAEDSFLLNRYIQRFSRTYPAFCGPSNPFLSILLPLSAQSRVVLDCLLALSAVQSWENESFALESAMLRLRDRALRGCRDLLVQERKSQLDTTFMLASCILLLLYEKLAGEGQQNWTPHLHFFSQLLRQHPDLNVWRNQLTADASTPGSGSATLRFLTSLFYYNDLVYATSLETPTLSDFYLGGIGASDADSNQSMSVGRFIFPCLITRLRAGDLTVTDADIAVWQGRLDWMPSLALSHDIEGHSDDGFEDFEERQTISQLYRLAAMVYRRQRLRELSAASAEPEGSESSDIADAGFLALQATELLHRLPDGSVYDTSTLWPIGIIAKELGDGSTIPRDYIISKLRSLETRFQMRHFGLVRKHLHKYWETTDQSRPRSSTSGVIFG